MTMPLKIVGVGHYLPERVVPSSEIEARCGLRPGWVAERTGVLERRWVNGPDQSGDGALLDTKGTPVNGLDSAEGFGRVTYFQKRQNSIPAE